MRKLKCIIVDDEPIARKIIREFLSQLDYLALAGEFENALKAESFLNQEQIDIVFLDIEMPKLSGVDWLKKTTVKPLVILTTAFPKYALEGYELDIIDYLLKPISYNRFLKAVQKAKDFIQIKDTGTQSDTASWLFVRSDKRIEKIEIEKIQYIESTGNYIHIHSSEKTVMAYLTLKGIESRLPANSFIKIHQSVIVNFPKIEAIEGNLVKVYNKQLPIGRSYRDAFMKVVEERLVKR